jgi:flagellar biosynthesis protein FlhF
VRTTLLSFWRPGPATASERPAIHVFIGPPGSGKTTVLCKWLAKAVLSDGQSARTWRLDGRGPNHGGLLDIYGEILGVSVEREWNGVEALGGCDAVFIDFPGVNAEDEAALGQLPARFEGFGSPQVHLVLNAAYDMPILLTQARAFSVLPVTDLIFTHLDEEKRHGKIWNIVLGTNYSVRYLSTGQNIPGDLSSAAPELLISR